MLALALIVNVLIVTPLTIGLLARRATMDAVYGPDSDARRILACIYGAIGIVSLYALVQMGLGTREVAVMIATTLFPLQIAYKLATAVFVGLQSPVVITNLVVSALQIVVLATI